MPIKWQIVAVLMRTTTIKFWGTISHHIFRHILPARRSVDGTKVPTDFQQPTDNPLEVCL